MSYPHMFSNGRLVKPGFFCACWGGRPRDRAKSGDVFRCRPATLLILVALAMVPIPAVAETVVVNTCGLTLDEKVSKVIIGGDLSCANDQWGVRTLGAAKVNLAGYTISGGTTGIITLRNCTISSDPPGGTITGFEAGIDCGGGTSNRADARISDVVLAAGGSGDAIRARGKIRLDRVDISDFGGDGSVTAGGFVRKSVKVTDSSIVNVGGYGVLTGGEKSGVRLIRSTVSGSGLEGVFSFSGRISIRDSIVTGNGSDGVGRGIISATKIRDSDVSNNGGYGILYGRIKVIDSTVNGNALSGARSGLNESMRIKNSTLVGNGTSLDCGVTIGCADLQGSKLPRLVGGTVCETSYETNSGLPGSSWGICSLD